MCSRSRNRRKNRSRTRRSQGKERGAKCKEDGQEKFRRCPSTDGRTCVRLARPPCWLSAHWTHWTGAGQGAGCTGGGTSAHYVCVWKDRNLSLTSHRQLSTYSFEVYLVVLLLPLLDWMGRWWWWWFWGIRVWSFIPTDWEIEWSVRRWVRQFVNFASFCLLSLPCPYAGLMLLTLPHNIMLRYS